MDVQGGEVFYDYERDGWAWKYARDAKYSPWTRSKQVYDYAWQAASALSAHMKADKADRPKAGELFAALAALLIACSAWAQCPCPPANLGCMGGGMLALDPAGVPVGSTPQAPGTDIELRLLGILPPCVPGASCIPVTGGWSHVLMPDGSIVIASLDAGLVCPGVQQVIGQVPYTVDADDVNPQFGVVVILGGWGPTTWFPGAEMAEQVGFPGSQAGAFGSGIAVHVTSPLAGSGGTCIGDIDGSAVVDVLDLVAVLEHWGELGTRLDCQALGSGPSRGRIDVEDLAAVIAAWGECK